MAALHTSPAIFTIFVLKHPQESEQAVHLCAQKSNSSCQDIDMHAKKLGMKKNNETL